jgi:hypothetical protein
MQVKKDDELQKRRTGKTVILGSQTSTADQHNR